mmetsp:Transcript_6440/g.19022  ORF Transcript_6440/g.19022 Transcript_6440/m.19022 type:complete len:183 (+) Transcript_6440:13-561(+)
MIDCMTRNPTIYHSNSNARLPTLTTMQRQEAELTPEQEWQNTLNATCNRLSTQYLNLLKAASSVAALEKGRTDPRSGGGHMKSPQDPPPPPLASDVAMSSLQCQLAAENLCVATSNLLSLIRTLRLSIMLMDEETIGAEEELQIRKARKVTLNAVEEANRLEQKCMELRNGSVSIEEDRKDN